MTAKELVQRYGSDLIGQLVMTQQIGSYPGGVARVIAIAPDPAAPEIAYQVENPKFMGNDGEHDIGVFEDEEASVLTLGILIG